MLVNYALGNAISSAVAGSVDGRHRPPSKKAMLIFGVLFNLLLLSYFKYFDFFLANINVVFEQNFPMLDLLLPLAISFFTFQQIAYLVDSYRLETREYDFLNYCLFVTFFPQLIAGPIVHHSQMMPQFDSVWNRLLRWRNVAQGSFIFAMGLFKKIVIADSFAVWADQGFDSEQALSFFDAWGASLSYSFQLYYDFSGYCDMAIGAALLFNIRLPINFNSPYKALDIQDFWRRWHITLSNWLRDYLYIPLGGNRGKVSRTYINLFLTFLLGGLWHGAGWTFVVWGALHGMALCVHRLWTRAGFKMAAFPAWLSTFIFANVAWIFFRAESLEDSMRVLKGMAGINGIAFSSSYAEVWNQAVAPAFSVSAEPMLMPVILLYYLSCFATIAFFLPNALQIGGYLPYRGVWAFKRGAIALLFISGVLFYSLVAGIHTTPSTFLYFNF